MNRKIVGITILVALVTALPLFAGGGREESAAEPMEEMAEETMSKEETPDDPRLYEPGKLTVATGEPVYPPWMLNDDPAGGEGFENGVVYALAAELGFAREDVVWVRTTFDAGITPGAKPYDFNTQQFSITEERREFVDFSIPFYQPDKAVVALPDSPVAAATSFADLRRARWGATIGTTDLNYIEDIIGVDDVAVFNDQVGTFQALLGGQIDATTINLPTALFATAVQVPEARIVAILPPDQGDLGLGLVFEKGNPLLPWINEGLQAILDDGTVSSLVTEYLIGDDSIEVISE